MDPDIVRQDNKVLSDKKKEAFADNIFQHLLSNPYIIAMRAMYDKNSIIQLGAILIVYIYFQDILNLLMFLECFIVFI